jgi:hypothetical protein
MEINGKKVVDATKLLRIEITKQDAERGRNKDPGGCAAALAIVRSFKKEGAKAARVHLGRIYVEYPDKWVRYKTPAGLKTEIVSFDRGRSSKFMEGTYGLQPIPPTDRLGARAKTQGRTSSSDLTKSKRPKIARAIHQIEGVRARGANR